jgi:hypothetical protein
MLELKEKNKAGRMDNTQIRTFYKTTLLKMTKY